MRRRPRPPQPIPEHLARLVPGEWHGDPWSAYHQWRAARRAWSLQNRFSPDSGDSPIGDLVDQLRTERAARAVLLAQVPDPNP
jgi:hypothetical protein